MTRMTGPDCVVMCNLINTYIHTYIHTYVHTYIHEGHRMTRMTGPDCAVMCNSINIHTYIDSTYIHTPQNSCRRRAGNSGDMGGKRKNIEKKGLVQ